MLEQTQREWLEEQLSLQNLWTPTGQRAEEIIAAWPSSPQGLAAKQLVEATSRLREKQRSAFLSYFVTQSHREAIQDAGLAVDLALSAARKAGVA